MHQAATQKPKLKCLSQLILNSESQLQHVLSEFTDYYHTGRVHQGIGKIIEPKHQENTGEIFCIERLGGLIIGKKSSVHKFK